MSRRARAVVGGLMLSVGLGLTGGCQTWLGGMTLPSPSYLSDNPDYIPPGPSFPLQRELAAQKAAAATLNGANQPGVQP